MAPFHSLLFDKQNIRILFYSSYFIHMLNFTYFNISVTDQSITQTRKTNSVESFWCPFVRDIWPFLSERLKLSSGNYFNLWSLQDMKSSSLQIQSKVIPQNTMYYSHIYDLESSTSTRSRFLRVMQLGKNQSIIIVQVKEKIRNLKKYWNTLNKRITRNDTTLCN